MLICLLSCFSPSVSTSWDTLCVPVGSRILGQAWSQIVAKGANFEDEMNTRVVIQVGRAGDVGIIEIQSMMFAVSDATAGAVLLEWNVHESTQGSSGMWGEKNVPMPFD